MPYLTNPAGDHRCSAGDGCVGRRGQLIVRDDNDDDVASVPVFCGTRRNFRVLENKGIRGFWVLKGARRFRPQGTRVFKVPQGIEIRPQDSELILLIPKNQGIQSEGSFFIILGFKVLVRVKTSQQAISLKVCQCDLRKRVQLFEEKNFSSHETPMKDSKAIHAKSFVTLDTEGQQMDSSRI